jgi:hypothetical protein
VTQVLALEKSLGMAAGHAETTEAVERLINRLEPSEANPSTKGASKPARH